LDSMYYYNVSDGAWHQIGSLLNSYYFKGVDFNPNDNRFYAVGERFTTQWIGTTFYTDPVPLAGGSNCYLDQSSFSDSKSTYNSIAWNVDHDYGMVAANGGVYLVNPYSGSMTLNWTIKVNNSVNTYYDCSWDTDGYNEAAIVGSNNSGHSYYWRYYHTNPTVMYGHHDINLAEFRCCDFKPPSSPKWLLIPVPPGVSGFGGWQINVQENDQSTILNANANFPHIFSIGFWKQNDVFKTPLLNTQVDPDTTYTFYFEGNYTQGGVDHWANAELEIAAWYDEFNTGVVSNPSDPAWSSEDHRTRQFNITYDMSTGTSNMVYPTGFPEEFAIHSTWVDPNTYGFDNSHRRVYINITFKGQTLSADGDGMWDAPTSGRTHEKNFALNDANSWDFRMALYDQLSTDARNETFDEFGIKESVSISVIGSPSGNLPPGSTDSPLATYSNITYSSNNQYWVNISIPHLYKDGTPGPDFIPSTGISIQNQHPLADGGSSQISTQSYFPGPGGHLCVWGLAGPIIPLNPTYNGTGSAGPGNSDYSAAIYGLPNTTEVYWWVTVPAGLPEGSYWGTITISIDDW